MSLARLNHDAARSKGDVPRESSVDFRRVTLVTAVPADSISHCKRKPHATAEVVLGIAE
jgi:hypothetical protein